jgi:dipeptidyl aminopeptidase/acylaminoacyl peptidase
MRMFQRPRPPDRHQPGPVAGLSDLAAFSWLYSCEMRATAQMPLLFSLMCSLPVHAQAPAATSRNPPAAGSQVQPDGRVTFRIAAPKATEVTLSGDWVDVPATTKLVKDEQGVWTTTVGPLRPDDYLYWFTVDGVSTPDPANPTVHQRTHAVQNVLHISGPAISFAENRFVPHGEIRQVRYISSAGRVPRRMHVYTPPGYERRNSQYPVLYLLHGGGDDDAAWGTHRTCWLHHGQLAGRATQQTRCW